MKRGGCARDGDASILSKAGSLGGRGSVINQPARRTNDSCISDTINPLSLGGADFVEIYIWESLKLTSCPIRRFRGTGDRIIARIVQRNWTNQSPCYGPGAADIRSSIFIALDGPLTFYRCLGGVSRFERSSGNGNALWRILLNEMYVFVDSVVANAVTDGTSRWCWFSLKLRLQCYLGSGRSLLGYSLAL